MFDDLKQKQPIGPQDPTAPRPAGPLPEPPLDSTQPLGQSSGLQPSSVQPAQSEAEDILQEIEGSGFHPQARNQQASPVPGDLGVGLNQNRQKPPELKPIQETTAPDKTPSNLPTAPSIEPAVTSRQSGMSHETEDIFSDVDASSPKVKSPSRPVSAPAAPPAGIAPQGPQDFSSQVAGGNFGGKSFGAPKKSLVKRIVLVFIVLLLVAGIGYGGWFVYAKYFSARALIKQDIQTNDQGQSDDEDNPLDDEQAVPQPSPVPTVDPDTDFDGIPDSEELLYGTSPNSADSDGDGLTDRDEIRTFKTDPLNPDTDGDGFKDQEEIINGYDPKGPGRLKDFD